MATDQTSQDLDSVHLFRSSSSAPIHVALKKQNEKSDENNEKYQEMMLVVGSGNFKKFKGCCHNCGKYGHKAYPCKAAGENKDKKNNKTILITRKNQKKKFCFQGHCSYCYIYWH